MERAYTRRGLLRTGAGATAAVAAASAAGTAAAQTDFDGWLSDVSNYDGSIEDMTGQDQVTVTVGAEGNNGNYAFGPPAIRVDPGTTVQFEWNGQGGQHNVVDEGGSFESELTSEEGFTYEQTFDSEGVVKYFCRPHRPLGMKGVVVVGDPDLGGGDGNGGNGGGDGGNGGNGGNGEASGPQNSANQTTLQTLLAMLVLGFLSPLLFALFLRRRQKQQRQSRGR